MPLIHFLGKMFGCTNPEECYWHRNWLDNWYDTMKKGH